MSEMRENLELTAADSTAHTPSSDRALSGVTALAHLGVIRVTGADAVTFLQGQLTQDVALLKPDEARLAAFCNAKGRMQASFVMFKQPVEAGHDVLLVCERDLLPQTLKRLSMFVMRAKAKLSDASAEFALYGVVGDAVKQALGVDLPLWHVAAAGDAQVIGLHPGAGQARALWCAPAASAAPAGPQVDVALWQWLSVESGIALVSQPIFEAFVPQMLNYESVGGVSFKKGCYPGQEIVARSQFRGTLKRRAYVLHGIADDVAPTVGQEIFHASDADQPCGLVAAAALMPTGGFAVIASMQTSAAVNANEGLMLGSAGGPALSLQPLPYDLLEDI